MFRFTVGMKTVGRRSCGVAGFANGGQIPVEFRLGEWPVTLSARGNVIFGPTTLKLEPTTVQLVNSIGTFPDSFTVIKETIPAMRGRLNSLLVRAEPGAPAAGFSLCKLRVLDCSMPPNRHGPHSAESLAGVMCRQPDQIFRIHSGRDSKLPWMGVQHVRRGEEDAIPGGNARGIRRRLLRTGILTLERAE